MRVAINRKTTYLLALVAMVGLSIQWLGRSNFFAFGADSGIAEPAAPALQARETKGPHERRTGDLTPAAAKLLFALAHRTSDASNANDLFASKSWYVAPPPPPPAPAAAPPPPTAPPLPYTFVGSYTEGNQATVYFLTAGDRVYDVRPGDTLDQIYSVDAVENGTMIITYKPLNIRQTLAVGGAP